MIDDTASAVGKPLPGVDGVSKVRGTLRFLQDLELPGMLHARMVLAGEPHAVIKDLGLEEVLLVSGVVAVASARDVPGENRVGVVVDDQPLFAQEKVRYEAECLALVGAVGAAAAAEAVKQVDVVYEPLPAVVGVEGAEAEGAPAIHQKGNLAVDRGMTKGDIDRGLRHSAYVVEEVFHSPVQEHAYLEPLGALAIPGADESMEILAPAQCPFYIRDAVSRCLGLALSKVHVVQLPMGGGFGGKEDVPSEICARLAVLAFKTRRPVKMVLSREEDIIYTSKRHPMRLHYRMGCDKTGRLTFADIEIAADVGAYATLSPIVLFRSTVHAAGPYEIPHVRVRTRGYYTNTVPKGAMRGFGTPQVVFACEAVVDELAAQAGLDPLEFRLRNALRAGSRTATGQVLESSVGLEATLKRADGLLGPDADRFAPRTAPGKVVKARGMASMFYGVSLGAVGRTLDRGAAKVEILKDGSVDVFVGCTDMGQGALTILSQITADSLGVGVERVNLNRVDTRTVPDSGPTVASRTTVISGNAIIDACAKLKARLVKVASSILGEEAAYDSGGGGARGRTSGRLISFDGLVAECTERRVDLAAMGWYATPECEIDAATGLGKAYYAYSFATDVAEVEVDGDTGQVRVTDFIAVHDSGSIINPLTAAGQVEGGIAQGIGMALFERFSHSQGRITSSDLSTYLIPTCLDLCDSIRVEFTPAVSPDGPFGAKGLGEPAIIPVPAAVANAVSNALGRRVTRLPVSPDWVLDLPEGVPTGS